MIKKGSKSIASRMKGSNVIQFVYKGALLVYQAIKKYLASGVFPLTLGNTVGSDLTNYKIEGNSVQQGKNLFNDTLTDGYISSTGADVSSVNNVKNTKVINIPSNVTLSFNTDKTIGKISFCYYENGIFTRRVETYTSEHKLTTSLLGNENGIRFYITSSNDMVASDVSNVQIEVGTTATEYEPYLYPTPDNPIEIESVGDKTKNLFNKYADYIFTTDKTISVEYTETGVILTNNSGANNWCANVYSLGNVEDLADQTIYVKTNVKLNGVPQTRIVLGYADSNGSNRVTSESRTMSNDGEYSVSLKIDKETYKGKVVAVWLYSHGSNDVTAKVGTSVEYSNLMVSIGNQEYEPYGYKIPVTTSGKNFIPRIFTSETKNGITLDVNDDGTLHVYGTATADTVFNPKIYGLQPNTYFLSGCPSGGSNSTYRLLAYFVTPKYNLIEHGSGKGYTLSVESDVVIEVKVYSGQTVDLIYKPMLEVGEVGTEYEPYQEPITTNIYLDEPLRKIGDYADYIDFANKKVVRNIKEIELTGNEAWVRTSTANSYGGGDKYRFRLVISDIVFSTGVVTKSNKYIGVTPDDTWFNIQGISANSSGTNPWIIIYDEDKATGTVEEFKTYLNGSPIIADYVVSTPIEETIELPSIPTLEGTTILDSDVKIQPSNVEVEYTNEKPKTISFVMANGDTFLDANGNTFILKEG